jgi:hypothetical protein
MANGLEKIYRIVEVKMDRNDLQMISVPNLGIFLKYTESAEKRAHTAI